MSVTLRPLTASDAQWLDDWLASSSAAVGYEVDVADPTRSLLARIKREPQICARVIERDASAAGIAIYQLDRPAKNASMFELIAVPGTAARRGSGMMAASACEEEMRAVGVSEVFAPAPERHGISVYFWIRLGYHPLLRPVWPCAREGVAWLTREIRHSDKLSVSSDAGEPATPTVRTT